MSKNEILDPPPRKSSKKPRSGKRIDTKEKVHHYRHHGKTRAYTPPVGLVDPSTDVDLKPCKYKYSPHLDPSLNWTCKDENKELEVPTVSLHLHERIDSMTIIEKVLKKETHVQETLTPHFEMDENNPPLRKAIQFYKHSNDWSNRFIAGDSLLVMNSLLKKEDLAGKVQMIYVDPPYGIKYGSNFQPFINKKEVKDRSDDDLAYMPETIRAFRDTWELGIHSYLSYLRDRLILAKELLTESGSCAVQISDENLHYVRLLMDEVFGSKNFVSLIPFRKTSLARSVFVPIICDYIVWYAKDIKHLKYNKMFSRKSLPINDPNYKYLELVDGTRRPMFPEERINPLMIPSGSKIYRHSNITSEGKSNSDDIFEFQNEKFTPGPNQHWKVKLEGMYKLAKENRLAKFGKRVYAIRYFDDFSYVEITNMWNDTSSGGFENKIYVVQSTAKTIRRFLLMTTDPSDLVLDPTCGSGTTAFVAEQYGRRWITCDTQRVALTLAKKRLMTANFKYYKLLHTEQGIGSGFSFTKNSIKRKTMKSLAYDDDPEHVILHDLPDEEKNKIRVSGPFTVEAVPSPTAMSLDTMYGNKEVKIESDKENMRQEEWRNALRNAGIRAKKGQQIEFSRVEPHPTSKWIHAVGKTNETNPKTVMVSFGPPYAPLEPRQVESAIQEARMLKKKPDMLVFAAMQFDPEAAKDIDELDWPGINTLKAQMNADMLTSDLRKGDPYSDSFMLIGQPDVRLKKTKEKYTVEVLGFDYYDAKNGKIESGSTSQIAMWMLDTDYDGRSMYPQQVFFPMASNVMGGEWEGISRALKNHIDLDMVKSYTGTKSLEFELGKHKRIAVKIIDDRGIELLRILEA